MPVCGAIHPVENDAVDTADGPDVVEIAPMPDTPAGAVHALSVYSVNVTDPVGAAELVVENVARSPTVEAVPTVIEAGFACVAIAGDAFPTPTTSLAAPQAVETALLFASPA